MLLCPVSVVLVFVGAVVVVVVVVWQRTKCFVMCTKGDAAWLTMLKVISFTVVSRSLAGSDGCDWWFKLKQHTRIGRGNADIISTVTQWSGFQGRPAFPPPTHPPPKYNTHCRHRRILDESNIVRLSLNLSMPSSAD